MQCFNWHYKKVSGPECLALTSRLRSEEGHKVGRLKCKITKVDDDARKCMVSAEKLEETEDRDIARNSCFKKHYSDSHAEACMQLADVLGGGKFRTKAQKTCFTDYSTSTDFSTCIGLAQYIGGDHDRMKNQLLCFESYYKQVDRPKCDAMASGLLHAANREKASALCSGTKVVAKPSNETGPKEGSPPADSAPSKDDQGFVPAEPAPDEGPGHTREK